MDLEQIYRGASAYLQGHFLLSSGNHSEFYLQSAKVLENPELAGRLADELAAIIEKAFHLYRARRSRDEPAPRLRSA